MQAPHEAAVECLLSEEDPTRVGPLEGPADADDAGQEPTGACFQRDAAPREDEAELCVRRGDADVHRQGHGDAHTDGSAVDRADDGLQAVVDPQGDHAAAVAGHAGIGVDLAASFRERRTAAPQICPGAERPPAAGDDHGPNIVVGVGEIERCAELPTHQIGERVHPVGTVQRDGCDVVCDVVGDLLEGAHVLTLPTEVRRRGSAKPRCRSRSCRRRRRSR